MKNQLIVKLMNIKDVDDSMIYKRVGDIALTLWIYIGHYEDNFITMKVAKGLFDESEEELFEIALHNTEKEFPAVVFEYEKVLANPDYSGTDFLTGKFNLRLNEGNCFTNSLTYNGAVTLFYPSVQEKLLKELGTGFYVAFTSVHEAIVHAEGTMSIELIKGAIDGMKDIVSDDIFLTDVVYYFDKNKTWSCL